MRDLEIKKVVEQLKDVEHEDIEKAKEEIRK